MGGETPATAWNDYVSGHPDATQYHRYEWLEVIARSFGHSFFPLVETSGGRIVGVLPVVLVRSLLFGRFLVSMPFVNYGGILADDEAGKSSLWDQAIARARETGARHLEVRHFVPHAFVAHRKQHKATMILDLLETSDAQWKSLDAKVRNQVRKAERSGLSARLAGPGELGSFYSVFARCMRDLGTPVYGPEFFADILRTFPDSARLLLVEHEGEAVAGAVALAHRDVLEVPWAGSLREHRARCPNNLLYWELIRLAIDQGLRKFDFGRSSPDDGPYRFKKQWGARPVPLFWEYWLPDGAELPELNPKNQKFRAAIELWKRLPLALTNRLGPSVVRGIP